MTNPDALKPKPFEQFKDSLFRLVIWFVNRGVHVLLLGGHAYCFERLIAVVGCFFKPNNYAICFSVDFRHGLNLPSLFVIVFLVDTDSIYLNNAFKNTISKV